MSQYLPQNPQRIYQSSFQYSVPPQQGYFLVQSQRNPPIRQASLNRNYNTNSSMVIKPGKIQQNSGIKLKRQNSLKNSIQYKQNDPYAKNSIVNHPNIKLFGNHKESSDYISQFDVKNTYCNPLIVKREKVVKDMSHQKTINRSQSGENQLCQMKNSLKTKENQEKQNLEKIYEKIAKIQNIVKQNSLCLNDHKLKIQKLEICFQNQLSKGQQNRKHSRNVSNVSSNGAGFKQISDIMNLIEETKNYQIRNSEEYRKKFQEFRQTILQFRDELNKTTKKQEVDAQIGRIKQILGISSCQNSLNGSHVSNLRKSSIEISSKNGSSSKKQIEWIQKQLMILRGKIEKLDEGNIGIKAEIVKNSLKQQTWMQEVQIKVNDISIKLDKVQKIKAQNEFGFKKGNLYQGKAVCFEVVSYIYEKQNYNLQQINQKRNQQETQSHKTEQDKILKVRLKQKTYFVDKDGYLLDSQNYYLLNDNNQQIKLSNKEIQALKKLKIMN